VKPGQTVYIASGTSFPDALAGGAAAGKAQAPILLVQSDWISGSVLSQLAALKPKNIVILGGTGVIDSAVQKALAQYTASGSASAVTRVGGTDRYQTSAELATANFSAGVKNAYVAVGSNWPDALSGSAVAASTATSGPMLLVDSNTIPSTVASALATLKPQKITIFGGTGVVSPTVATALQAYTASKSASSVVRIGGKDRYATSSSIALTEFSAGVPAAYAASGTDFPDALAAAPLASLSGAAPVLLVTQNTIPSDTGTALSGIKPKSIAVIGGSGAVAAAVQTALAKFVVN
jgi:putative cell wall-binding protein